MTAAALVHRDDRRAWRAGAALALLTITGYAVNRTVGLPSASGDIGNWLEPIGLAALFVEVVTAAVCIYALSDERRPATALSASRRDAERAPVG